MSTLIIRKKSLKTWLHIDSVIGQFIISKFYFNADDNRFQVVEQGQSKRVIYDVSDITLYDDTTGGSAETFANITALSLRLEELNYPAFQYDGQIVSIANLIQEGTNVTITGDGTEASPYVINSSGGGNQDLESVLTEGNESTTQDAKFVIDTENYILINRADQTIDFYTTAFGSYASTLVTRIGADTFFVKNFADPTTTSVGISQGQLSIRDASGGNYAVFEKDKLSVYNDSNVLIGDYAYPTGATSQIATLLDINAIIQTSNFTASNDKTYTSNGTLTVTDPTPVTNKGFIVHIIGGSVTIGGVAYTSGALVYRYYDGNSWISTSLVNSEQLENINESLSGFVQTTQSSDNLIQDLISGALVNNNTLFQPSSNLVEYDIPVVAGETYTYTGIVAISTSQAARSAVLCKKTDGTFVELLDVKLNTDPTAGDEVTVDLTMPSDAVSVSVSFRDTSVNKIFKLKVPSGLSNIEVKSYIDGLPTQNASTLQSVIQRRLMPRASFKLKNLKSGSTSDVFNVGFFGDSWTQSVPSSINYVRELSILLKAVYGDGGAGFYDFSRSGASDFMRSADIDDVTDIRSGSISYSDQQTTSTGINIANASFNAGGQIVLSILRGQQSATIHYKGGTGTFSYQIGGGSVVNVDTTGAAAYATIDITLNDTVETLTISRVSGTNVIYGVDFKRNYGVRVHKLGNRGLLAQECATVDVTNWKNGLTKLNLDSFFVLLGTNDKTAGRTDANIFYDIKKILKRVQEVNPLIDRCIITPSNNQTFNLEGYDLALKKLSIESGVSYISLVNLFGSVAQINSIGSFFDTYHPTENMGKKIAERIYNFLIE